MLPWGAGADIQRQSGGWSGEKGGAMGVDTPGQHVLERSSVIIDSEVRPLSQQLGKKSGDLRHGRGCTLDCDIVWNTSLCG